MRDWERLVATPNNDVTRHALVPLSSSTEGSPALGPTQAPLPMPKLAAERDKEGHIEYKLKLIEPSPERFERLVTQMMWRLKQGRNEAIYELGLADDGTVIGLTRAEMDASLATLERMASEVGATVLVLKEIVLTAPPDARRPDLDENGRPRKGTRGLGEAAADTRSRRERLRARREAEAEAGEGGGDGDGEASPPRLGARAIIFDPRDAASDSDDDDAVPVPSSSRAEDDDDAHFHLDLDTPPRPASATSATSASTPTSTTSRSRAQTPAQAAASAEAAARAEAKRHKSAARREARRLDLLRGDGTGLPFADRSRSPVAEFIGHAPATHTIAHMLPPHASGTSAAQYAQSVLPHRPARPSSLRLERKPASEGDDFVDGLGLPLDSLSLSFADVHSAATSPGAAGSGGRAGGDMSLSSMGTESGGRVGESEPGGGTGASTTPSVVAQTHALAPIDPASLLLAPPGEELICVEALVVRKHGDEWGYGGEEDGWGFGAGEDDGWGLGGGDEGDDDAGEGVGWRLDGGGGEEEDEGTERENGVEGEGLEEEGGWGF